MSPRACVQPTDTSRYQPGTEARYGYLNTTSTAGRGQWYRFRPNDVTIANVWHDSNGNPQTMLYFRDGSRLRLVSDYGALNGLRIQRTNVDRLKDL